MALCREEVERNRIASEHHHRHLLVRSPKELSNCILVESAINKCIDYYVFLLQHAGMQGLSINIMRNKTHRLDNIMAVQHHQQTVTGEQSIQISVSATFFKVFKATKSFMFVFVHR